MASGGTKEQLPRKAKVREIEALLASLSDVELAKAWALCMRTMRERDLVRTANTPVGDYAERIVCARLGLDRKDFSERSVDAVDGNGTRYQIKGRRLTPQNKSRQLSAIREIEQQPFDILLAAFFNEELDLQELWKIPCEVVKEAAFVARTNSTRFVLTKKVQNDHRVERLL